MSFNFGEISIDELKGIEEETESKSTPVEPIVKETPKEVVKEEVVKGKAAKEEAVKRYTNTEKPKVKQVEVNTLNIAPKDGVLNVIAYGKLVYEETDLNKSQKEIVKHLIEDHGYGEFASNSVNVLEVNGGIVVSVPFQAKG